MMSRPGLLACSLCLLAAPLPAAGLGSGAVAPPAARMVTIVVLDFELAGDLGRDPAAAPREARLRMFGDELRRRLEQTGRYAVARTEQANEAIERLGSRETLRHCSGCEYEIGEALGADQVLLPWVYRVSTRVLTLHVDIEDVHTRRILTRKAFDFRADNDAAWLRAIDSLVRELERALHEQ
jgi:hypothetical protein